MSIHDIDDVVKGLDCIYSLLDERLPKKEMTTEEAAARLGERMAGRIESMQESLDVIREFEKECPPVTEEEIKNYYFVSNGAPFEIAAKEFVKRFKGRRIG